MTTQAPTGLTNGASTGHTADLSALGLHALPTSKSVAVYFPIDLEEKKSDKSSLFIMIVEEKTWYFFFSHKNCFVGNSDHVCILLTHLLV